MQNLQERRTLSAKSLKTGTALWKSKRVSGPQWPSQLNRIIQLKNESKNLLGSKGSLNLKRNLTHLGTHTPSYWLTVWSHQFCQRYRKTCELSFSAQSTGELETTWSNNPNRCQLSLRRRKTKNLQVLQNNLLCSSQTLSLFLFP